MPRSKACAEGPAAPCHRYSGNDIIHRFIYGVAPVKVSRHHLAAAHMPERQEKLQATKDEFLNRPSLSPKVA